VGGAFGAFVGLGLELRGHEAGAGELPRERGLPFRGPKGNPSAGTEGPANERKPVAGVKPGVFRLHERCRAVVHIEENGIEFCGATPDALENIAREDAHARVIEKLAVEARKKLPVPRDDLGQKFGHLNGGLRPRQLEHAPKAEPEPEPANQDTRRINGHRKVAGEVGEQTLGNRVVRTHELAAVELEKILPVMLVQRKPRTIRRPGLGKVAKGNHCWQAGRQLNDRIEGSDWA